MAYSLTWPVFNEALETMRVECEGEGECWLSSCLSWIHFIECYIQSQARPLERKEDACLPGQMARHLRIKNNFLLIFL